MHASVVQHRDGDEQIAEDRDEYDDAEDDPDDDDWRDGAVHRVTSVGPIDNAAEHAFVK